MEHDVGLVQHHMTLECGFGEILGCGVLTAQPAMAMESAQFCLTCVYVATDNVLGLTLVYTCP